MDVFINLVKFLDEVIHVNTSANKNILLFDILILDACRDYIVSRIICYFHSIDSLKDPCHILFLQVDYVIKVRKVFCLCSDHRLLSTQSCHLVIDTMLSLELGTERQQVRVLV